MKHIDDMIDDVHDFLYMRISRKWASTLHALIFVLLGWILAAITYHIL